MSITSTIHQGIPVLGQSITDDPKFKLIDVSATWSDEEKAAWKEKLEWIRNSENHQSPEEQAAQIAKQDAVPVKTVFRANNKIVAIITVDGGITSINGLGRIDVSGGIDKITERVQEQLSQLFNGGVQMDEYAANSGVTMGMAQDEMFLRGPQIPRPGQAVSNTPSGDASKVRVTYSSDMLEILHKAMERLYLR